MYHHYCGTLPPDGSLARFLADVVLQGALGLPYIERPLFDSYRLREDGTVLRYVERQTLISLVGKRFAGRPLAPLRPDGEDARAWLLRHEYEHLQRLRALGLDTPPYTVVRPLAMSVEHGYLLVEEYIPGPDLDAVVRAAVFAGKHVELSARLDELAGLLAALHDRSRTGQPIDQTAALLYAHKLITQLREGGLIGKQHACWLAARCDGWAAAGELSNGEQTLIHGDPTPSNVLFRGAGDVVAIDLERMRVGDPASDLGCVAAELKHLFALYGQGLWASEEPISQFYHRYAAHQRLGGAAFAALTTRGRFHMACYELRIARNPWLLPQHRHLLVAEAEACLRPRNM